MIDLRNLPLPCPLNALYFPIAMRVKNGHRSFNKLVKSKRARERGKLLVIAIQQQLGGKPEPMKGDVQVSFTITPRDRRTPDCDAFHKHLLDCLQHAGVFVSDKQVVHVVAERLPPQHPGHVDVQISEVQT